ncbi:hypothetical protein LCGC14_0853330, partial [marine sediment metagenome]
MPIPTDVQQGDNATPVNPNRWNELVDGINENRDYYSAEAVFDVTHENYGATGDGSTDDEPAIDLARIAATANGGALFFPGGSANNTYRISTNIAFDKDITLIFAPGATLAIDTGVTVTINGDIAPTLHKIFTLTGTGVVTLAAGSVEAVLPQWWGAVGDDSTDNHDAIEAAIAAALDAVGLVYLPAGIYRIGDTIDNFPYGFGTRYDEGITIRGADRNNTKIKYTPTSGFAIRLGNPELDSIAGAQRVNGVTISDLHITTPNLTADGGGVLFDGPTFSGLERVHFAEIGDGTVGTSIRGRRRHFQKSVASFTPDTHRAFTNSGGASDQYAIGYTTEALLFGRIQSVTVRLRKLGSPTGTMTASIYSNAAGVPDAIVEIASATVDISTFSTGATGGDVEFTFVFPGPSMTETTDFWIVLIPTYGTYNSGVDEVSVEVEAAADVSNNFATFDGGGPGWAASDDGSNYTYKDGRSQVEMCYLNNVYSRGIIRAMTVLDATEDSQFNCSQGHWLSVGTTISGDSPILRVMDIWVTNSDSSNNVINITGATAEITFTRCFLEGASDTDPYFFGPSVNPQTFTDCHIAGTFTHALAADLRFQGCFGPLFSTDDPSQIFDPAGFDIILPDDPRWLEVATPVLEADANAISGRRYNLDDRFDLIRFLFQSTVGEGLYGFLPRASYLVTVWAKDTNQVANDFKMVSGYYPAGSPTTIHSLTATLTASYAPYRFIHIIEAAQVGKRTYIDFFQNASGANDIYISHVTVRRIGQDMIGGDDIVSANPVASDADDARGSSRIFMGRQSGDEQSVLAAITASHDGAADDEKGKVEIYTNDGSDGFAPTLRCTLDSAGIWQIGDGGATNYMQIAGDGFVELNGTARATIDISFDPNNIKLPAANFPALSEIGLTPVFLFDKTADEELRGAFEIPHEYSPGTDLQAHFHWAPVDG